MRADMTNNEAMMIVTLTIPTQIVHKHAKNIFPGNGISITNFNILPKTVYDHGDCDRIILLNETSVVKKFPWFAQNIISYQTQQSTNLQRTPPFTQLEPLVQLSHLK
jgi:hypothetical protein